MLKQLLLRRLDLVVDDWLLIRLLLQTGVMVLNWYLRSLRLVRMLPLVLVGRHCERVASVSVIIRILIRILHYIYIFLIV